ncbi:MAG: hypothetical protein QNJ97_12360 [Myxococcota bacterium]|nr:hypothetical protein [Myxococcota bacterium]
MVARKIEVLSNPCSPAVLILGTSRFFTTAAVEKMMTSGFNPTTVVPDAGTAIAAFQTEYPDIVLIPATAENGWYGHMRAMEYLRGLRFPGVLAILTETPSMKDLVAAIRTGANDYLVVGKYLDITEEVVRLYATRKQTLSTDWKPMNIQKMGLFRSIGLTPKQIQLLVAYAQDFPRLGELAARLGQSENRLRKSFSRIYEKLEPVFAVNSPSRLAQLLTLCAAQV